MHSADALARAQLRQKPIDLCHVIRHDDIEFSLGIEFSSDVREDERERESWSWNWKLLTLCPVLLSAIKATVDIISLRVKHDKKHRGLADDLEPNFNILRC